MLHTTLARSDAPAAPPLSRLEAAEAEHRKAYSALSAAHAAYCSAFRPDVGITLPEAVQRHMESKRADYLRALSAAEATRQELHAAYTAALHP